MFQSKESQANAKLSSYLMMIIAIVIVLAVFTLLLCGVLLTTGYTVAAGIFALLGVIAIASAGAVLYQNRRQTTAKKNEPPKVMSIIECKSCGTKSSREHQRGDFVFKDVGACQKCSGRQVITGIFKEITEKEKTYAI